MEVDEGGGGGVEDLLGEDDERTKPLVTAAGEDEELFEDATRVDEVVGRGDVTLVMTLDGAFPTLAMAAVGPTAAEDEDARDLQAQSSANISRCKHNWIVLQADSAGFGDHRVQFSDGGRHDLTPGVGAHSPSTVSPSPFTFDGTIVAPGISTCAGRPGKSRVDEC